MGTAHNAKSVRRRKLSEKDSPDLSQLNHQVHSVTKIFDALPSGLYIKNEAGQYLFVNQKIHEMIFPRDVSMIGKTDSDIFPSSVVKKIRRSDLQVFKEKDQEHLITEKIPTRNGHRYFLTKKRVLPNIFEGKGDMIVCNASDITELKQAQGELDKANNYLRKINQLIPNAIFLFDLEQDRIFEVNEAFRRIFGFSAHELTPEFWLSRVCDDSKLNKKNFIARFGQLEKGEVLSKEICYRKSNGNRVWTNTSVTPFEYTNDDAIRSVMISIEDIHQMKVLQNKFRRESHRDHLTKLYNRRFFVRSLKKAIAKSLPFTLLFVDLNEFKIINDTYGHDVGDKILTDTARKLRTIFKRDTDIVARLGGDEFVVLIKGALEDKFNKSISSKLQTQFLVPYSSNNVRIHYRPSVGAVLIHNALAMTPEMVLNKADQAMYEAKKLSNFQIVSV